MIDKKDEFLETNIKGMMMTLLAHWNGEMDLARAPRAEYFATSCATVRIKTS